MGKKCEHIYVCTCVRIFITASHFKHQQNQIFDLKPKQDIAVTRTSLLLSVTENALKFSEMRHMGEGVKLTSKLSLKQLFHMKALTRKTQHKISHRSVEEMRYSIYLRQSAQHRRVPVRQIKIPVHANQPRPYFIFVRKQIGTNIKTYFKTFKSSKEENTKPCNDFFFCSFFKEQNI